MERFEGIAKTDTTHTEDYYFNTAHLFEGIAKTDTTHTVPDNKVPGVCLRVLLKQTQLTLNNWHSDMLNV